MRFTILTLILLVTFVGVPISLMPSGSSGFITWYSADAQIKFGGQIGGISVQGNQRFSDDAILRQSGLTIGQNLDTASLNAALKNLISSGMASGVEFSQRGNTLIIRVIEPRFVNRIFFDGNDSLKDEQLIEIIETAPADPYSQARIQRDVNTILSAYASQGRFQAEVRPYIADRGEGRLDLVFEIKEGSVARVGSVNFIGNASFSDSTLRGVVSTKQHNALRNLTAADRFTQLAIEADQQALVTFYQQRGYVDAKVTATQGALAADQSGFVVTFALEEGQRYRVGEVKVTSEVAGLASEDLARTPRIRQGIIFNVEDVSRAQEQVRTRAETLGFGAVEVRADLIRLPDLGLINIQFNVVNGPNIRVERIEIEGNLRTRDYVVRREMRLAEGDAFSRNRLQRSLQRIQGLGYFSNAGISTRPGSSPDQAIVVVNVEETSTGRLNFAGGASASGRGTLGLSYVENNFLGRGQKISLVADFSSQTRNYNLSVQEPWILGREISGSVNLFSNTTDSSESVSYKLAETGFALSLGYKLSERWTQDWSYTRNTSDVSDATTTSPVILDQVGRTTRSVIGTRLRYNDLDSFFTPSSGVLFDAAADWAGGGIGGNVDWKSLTVETSYFFPVSENMVGRLKAMAGRVSAGNAQPVPLVDRFTQGQNLVRGFAVGGIGPRTLTTGDPVGSTTFYGASAQIQAPIPGLKEAGLLGRAFVDMGTAFDQGRNYTLDFGSGSTAIQDSNAIRTSYGLGLTWLSPIGPVMLDWATPASKQAFDRTQEFSFNFGLGF